MAVPGRAGGPRVPCGMSGNTRASSPSASTRQSIGPLIVRLRYRKGNNGDLVGQLGMAVGWLWVSSMNYWQLFPCLRISKAIGDGERLVVYGSLYALTHNTRIVSQLTSSNEARQKQRIDNHSLPRLTQGVHHADGHVRTDVHTHTSGIHGA